MRTPFKSISTFQARCHPHASQCLSQSQKNSARCPSQSRSTGVPASKRRKQVGVPWSRSTAGWDSKPPRSTLPKRPAFRNGPSCTRPSFFVSVLLQLPQKTNRRPTGAGSATRHTRVPTHQGDVDGSWMSGLRIEMTILAACSIKSTSTDLLHDQNHLVRALELSEP